MDLQTDFETYWTTINPDNDMPDRYEAAQEEWNNHPEKHVPIMRWLAKHGAYKGRNPYFFIQDFKVRTPAATPTDYNNRPLPNVPVFSAKYNGKWGMFTQEDIDKFHLETYKN